MQRTPGHNVFKCDLVSVGIMQKILLSEIFRNGKIQFREDVANLQSIVSEDDIVFDFSGIDFISFSACDEFLKLVCELSPSGSVVLSKYSSSIKKVLEGQIIARQYPSECSLLMH